MPMRKRTGIFSVEFFPPKTAEGVEKLRAARRTLAELKPAFYSVTFGAGGSTREGTLATVLELRRSLRCAGHRDPDRAGHHADFKLYEARALFGCLRRGDSALDSPQARELRRRRRIDSRVRHRRRIATLRGFAGRRRARPPL